VRRLGFIASALLIIIFVEDENQRCLAINQQKTSLSKQRLMQEYKALNIQGQLLTKSEEWCSHRHFFIFCWKKMNSELRSARVYARIAGTCRLAT
jgi:hypothetical protein